MRRGSQVTRNRLNTSERVGQLQTAGGCDEREESMALAGTVGRAAPGIIGFDSATRINSAQVNRYYSQNYRFCVRCVSRDDASRQHNENNGTPDLSETEAQGILSAGLARG
jgi:hypothetical protein